MTTPTTNNQPEPRLREDDELRRFAEHLERADEKHGMVEEERRGFLPMDTNTFDRVFISIVVFVAVNLLWMRFLEAFLPLTVATVITIIIGYLIVRYG